MFQRIRNRRHGHVRSVLAATLLAASTLHAQPGAPEERSSYFGGWTLSRELSSSPTSPDTPTTGDREGRPGGGRGRGGVPGGGGGGGPRGGGGFGGAGGQSPLNAQDMKKTMALIQELMTPTAHWVITSGEGAITFTDSEGRSMRFVPNNKTEKHQLRAGTIETKTRWDNEQLRQEIALSGGIKAVRTLAVLPENGQLIVTTTMEGGPGSRGGRRPPLRLVYLRDGEL